MTRSGGRMLSEGLCLVVLLAAGCSSSSTKESKTVSNNSNKTDSEKIQGRWTILSVEVAGKKVPESEIKDSPGTFTFTRDKLAQKIEGKMDETSTFKLDPTKKPKAISLTLHMEKRELVNGEMKDSKMDVTYLGIYELDGDQLKICVNMPMFGPKERPSEFKTSKDAQRMLFVLKREKNKAR